MTKTKTQIPQTPREAAKNTSGNIRDRRSPSRVLRLDRGGVVAYTQGSRFKDADVLAVVQRVLKQS